MSKSLIQPEHCRQVPRKFGWVDHRLVREDRLKGLSVESWALYLFLSIVADREGLSWYSDKRIREYVPFRELASCRRELCRAGLLAYRDGVYQLLGLGTSTPTRTLQAAAPSLKPSAEKVAHQSVINAESHEPPAEFYELLRRLS